MLEKEHPDSTVTSSSSAAGVTGATWHDATLTPLCVHPVPLVLTARSSSIAIQVSYIHTVTDNRACIGAAATLVQLSVMSA